MDNFEEVFVGSYNDNNGRSYDAWATKDNRWCFIKFGKKDDPDFRAFFECSLRLLGTGKVFFR